MAFGISTTLRKSGLNQLPNPLLAAAVTVGTAFLVLCTIAHLGFGRRALQFNHQGSGWLFAAALFNAGAILSPFFALVIGKIVEIEPLVACNPLLTLLWTAFFLRGIERPVGADCHQRNRDCRRRSSRDYSSLKMHRRHLFSFKLAVLVNSWL
jgi:uncharacterized membrane protein